MLLAAPVVSADEPRSATEPRVMMESGEVTNVIDAFDEGDQFDLNVSLGFQYATKSARIRRETSVPGAGLTSGWYTSNLLNVASYSETTSRLIPRVDFGIYKDLAAHISLPIILSHSRELSDLDGSAANQAYILRGAPGEQLFSLPFASPDRSGLEYLGLGLDLNIMNQARDRTKPTWLFGFEVRLPVSQAMNACTTTPRDGQVECAHPSDIDRDGERDGDLEGTDVAPREPGVGRGTIGLEVHTLLSKRMKYVEPYGGFRALVEFYTASDDYDLTNLEGSLVNNAPLVGTVVLGMMIIPWENREKFGRLTFDMRIEAEYRSEGRDYSELFDPLGASDATSLRVPQWASYRGQSSCVDDDNNPMTPCVQRDISVVDEGSQKSYFTGLTNVQPFGSIRGSASATWQASELVKFQFGLGFRHDGAHGIGGDQPCNP
ncbi:MAG TPA: hypothetical protein VLS89_01645, partial [Candidatus Nanopelagicales bacterium]|nr:hypothetical protein [Candidatus Nanopelagicales bacterium]